MNGEKRSDGWVIVNSNWDNKVEADGTLVVTVLFEVREDLQSEMTIQEYAQYFAENYIKVSGSYRTSENRKGNVIKNNKSELTLEENEQQLNNITIEEDLDFASDNPNEKQYIIDVYNNTENDFIKIRGNIYLGEENELLEVSPSEIVSSHSDDSTFELPFWTEITAKSKLTFYIIVQTTEENFIPDIVMSATIR